jgi:hypothetical protein
MRLCDANPQSLGEVRRCVEVIGRLGRQDGDFAAAQRPMLAASRKLLTDVRVLSVSGIRRSHLAFHAMFAFEDCVLLFMIRVAA